MRLSERKQKRNAGLRMRDINSPSVSANTAARSITPTATSRNSAPRNAKRNTNGQNWSRNALPKKGITPSVKRLAYYHRKQSEQNAGEAI